MLGDYTIRSYFIKEDEYFMRHHLQSINTVTGKVIDTLPLDANYPEYQPEKLFITHHETKRFALATKFHLGNSLRHCIIFHYRLDMTGKIIETFKESYDDHYDYFQDDVFTNLGIRVRIVRQDGSWSNPYLNREKILENKINLIDVCNGGEVLDSIVWPYSCGHIAIIGPRTFLFHEWGVHSSIHEINEKRIEKTGKDVSHLFKGTNGREFAYSWKEISAFVISWDGRYYRVCQENKGEYEIVFEGRKPETGKLKTSPDYFAFRYDFAISSANFKPLENTKELPDHFSICIEMTEEERKEAKMCVMKLLSEYLAGVLSCLVSSYCFLS
jgi:hypothetical protein